MADPYARDVYNSSSLAQTSGLDLSALTNKPVIQNDAAAIVAPTAAPLAQTGNPMALGLQGLGGIGVSVPQGPVALPPAGPPPPPPEAPAMPQGPPLQGAQPVAYGAPSPQQEGAGTMSPGQMLAPSLRAAMGAVPVGGGGYTPAHEAATRGPKALAAIHKSEEARESAINAQADRTLTQAKVDEAMAYQGKVAIDEYTDQQKAIGVQREAESQAAIADMQKTISDVSKMRVEPNRFWSNVSTGNKIMAMVGIGLGGFVSGVRGGQNESLQAVNNAIDRDIKAQEAMFNSGIKTFEAKKSAFGALVEKYQSVDVARTALKAAMLDGITAQTKVQAAQHKGVESQNQADEFTAQLEALKAKHVDDSLKLVQAQRSEPRFAVPGFPFPLTRTEALALGMKGLDAQNALNAQDNAAGHSLAQQQVKERAEKGNKDGERMVTLPSGKSYLAPTAKDAEKAREQVKGALDLQRILAQAEEIRTSGVKWRIPTSPERARLESLQADAVAAYKNMESLGALDKGTSELSMQKFGDFTSQMPDANARIRSSQAGINAKLTNMQRGDTGENPMGRIDFKPSVSASSEGSKEPTDYKSQVYAAMKKGKR